MRTTARADAVRGERVRSDAAKVVDAQRRLRVAEQHAKALKREVQLLVRPPVALEGLNVHAALCGYWDIGVSSPLFAVGVMDAPRRAHAIAR